MSPAPARAAGRPASGVRLLALLVALLVVAVQPRAFAAGLPMVGSGTRVISGHAPRAESHAVRVEVALRVAPSPVLGREPCLPPRLPAQSGPGPWLSVIGAPPARAPVAAPLGQSLGHFHGQRRIPRMNSEEPPRP